MFSTPGSRVGIPRIVYPWWITELNQNNTNVLSPVATWRATSPPQTLFTRIDTAIVPVNGSLLGAVPDGLITGGAQRTPYSVDLQYLRTAANQVAGFQTPGAGAAGEGNVLVGGKKNSIRSAGAQGPLYCAIIGGNTNFISLTGGASGENSFIGGGTLVSITVGANTGARASIGGNTIDITANAVYSANIGGSNITLNNVSSFNLAGQQNTTSHDFAGTMGSYAATRTTNSFNIGGNNGDSAIGNSQVTLYPLTIQTNNAVATEITTDNQAAGTNNRLFGVIAAGEDIYFRGQIQGNAGTGTIVCTFDIVGFIYWPAGVPTLGVFTVTPLFSTGVLAGATVTNGGFGGFGGRQWLLNVTGAAATVVRWSGWIIASHRRG